MTKFAQGKYEIKNPAKYIGTKTPTYRSSWEFAFMNFADSNPNVIHWASESIQIPYRNPFTNKQTIYVPDFFIVYVDNQGKKHGELIEIKPSRQSTFESAKSQQDKAAVVLNTCKWQAAHAFCQRQGIRFRVVNEQDIFHNGKKNR